jgi:hypothetical protein
MRKYNIWPPSVDTPVMVYVPKKDKGEWVDATVLEQVPEGVRVFTYYGKILLITDPDDLVQGHIGDEAASDFYKPGCLSMILILAAVLTSTVTAAICL